jgi:hypothetical protein
MFKNKIIYNFMISVAIKIGRTNKNCSPSSFGAVVGSGIRDPGSRMDKNHVSAFGINFPDPQHWIFLNWIGEVPQR